MQVPIFRLTVDEISRQAFHDGCQQIFDSGILTNGEFVRRFEKRFSELCGTRHAVAVQSGTGALEVVLRAMEVSGRTVIIPTNTFIATARAVENAGGRILPLDIEGQTFALDPKILSRRISREVAAVIVVHIGGIVSGHIDLLSDICQRHGVPLIEDACHAHGAEHQLRRAGSFGLAGCFSFFPTKVMTTGEGGMVTTDDAQLYERLLLIRQFGMDRDNKDLHRYSGANFKMTEFQALLGLIELERLGQRLERRGQIAERYQHRLKGSSWQAIAPPAGGLSTYYKQIVLLPAGLSKKAVHEHLRKRKITLTGEVYRYPLHQQPIYREFRKTMRFPAADAFCEGHVCPPVYPELSDAEVDYVCQSLLEC